MSRSIPLLITALIASLLMALIVGAIAAARAPTPSPSTIRAPHVANKPAALGDASETCFTWDFLNNTGQDVNDLHIRLKGIPAIDAVYTGTLNPFGEADGTSGYDAGNDTYNLNFSNSTAYGSDKVQLGVCSDRSGLRLGTPAPAFFWTLTGTQQLPDPLFAGMILNWTDHTHAQLDLYNEQSLTLTLMSLTVLDADQPLPLDDLTDDIATLLPLANDLLPDPIAMGPLSNQAFNVEVPVANHYYVIEATLAAEDDPGNVIHVLAQSLAPPYNLYLPLVLK
jgi:hypothetical protein